MKTTYRNLLILLTIMINTLLQAQPGNPPGGGDTGDPIGNSAPVGDGLWWLLMLLAVYSLIRYYRYRQSTYETLEE